jgi:hypothetical protein
VQLRILWLFLKFPAPHALRGGFWKPGFVVFIFKIDLGGVDFGWVSIAKAIPWGLYVSAIIVASFAGFAGWSAHEFAAFS